MKRLPNFMIIGAGKSGTTALYEHLAAHPEVFMSPVKETNFFALEGQQLVDPKDDPNQMQHYPWSITNWEDYCGLYERAGMAKAIGEVSPMYLYSPIAAQKIKERLPNTKIIAILRDPVDRLYSRYMHLVRERREPTDQFSDALNRETIWWKRNDLVQEGFYFQHLKNYYDIFDHSQIRVYLYEDLRNNPLEVIKDIYEFIGVAPIYLPDPNAEFNVSGRIKNDFVDSLIGQDSLIKKAINLVSPALLNLIRSNTKLRRWVYDLRKSNLEKEPLKPEVRRALIDKVYGGEIIKLQWFLKRDLSKWLKAS